MDRIGYRDHDWSCRSTEGGSILCPVIRMFLRRTASKTMPTAARIVGMIVRLKIVVEAKPAAMRNPPTSGPMIDPTRPTP